MKFLQKPAVAWAAPVLMIAAAVVIGLTRGGSPASASPEKLGLDGDLSTAPFAQYILDEADVLSPEAEERMDDRMILKSDVIQVLQHLRESGEAVLEEDTGLFVTRERLGNVTFWVKYRETEKGYLVCSAYSHRMKVVTRQ